MLAGEARVYLYWAIGISMQASSQMDGWIYQAQPSAIKDISTGLLGCLQPSSVTFDQEVCVCACVGFGFAILLQSWQQSARKPELQSRGIVEGWGAGPGSWPVCAAVHCLSLWSPFGHAALLLSLCCKLCWAVVEVVISFCISVVTVL